jgi:hypothetical protein
MLVSNMDVRNNRSVVEVPHSGEVDKRGDEINNKDETSFQLGKFTRRKLLVETLCMF